MAPLHSQEAKTEDSAFEKESLALRTALHYDPALDAPLKRLVELYRDSERTDELIGLYRAHISEYPADAGAKVVFIRVLKALNRSEAGEYIQTAAEQHKDNAVLRYLLYQHLEERGDSRALEALSKAIELETHQNRKGLWLEEYLAQAETAEARAAAKAQLKAMRQLPGHTPETLLALARKMESFNFSALALETLGQAKALRPDPETSVEIEVLAARSEASQGNREAAAKRIDALLQKLAPDYWRRGEILSLRINLMTSDADRESLLAAAKQHYEANPLNEAAVLDLAEIYRASELRRDALDLLMKASRELPNSQEIEKQVLDLLDRLGAERQAVKFLTDRVAAFPKRADLRYRLAQALYLTGAGEEARKQLGLALEGQEEEARTERQLEMARYLRRMSQTKDAAPLFETVLESAPARLDVRRELAETYLNLERRHDAEQLIQSQMAEGAAVENFMDLVQFMIQKEFYQEAKNALEKRIAKADGDVFDLRLILIEVLGKLGDQDAAESAHLAARESADTPARYGQWLNTGMKTHEIFGNSERFFDDEQFRFLDEKLEWTKERSERFLNLINAGEESQLSDRVMQTLRTQLDSPGLPENLRVGLRQLLVKALEKSPDRAVEVEQQLQLLAKEDPAHADEYNLRRALLYHTANRPDLAQNGLEAVNVAKVGNPAVLRGAYMVFLEYGMIGDARLCLDKLTTLEPKDLNHWDRRLSLLAAMGDESELRKALRGLLAGIDQVTLSGDTVRSVRLHLLDSYWRSVSRLISTGKENGYREALPLLDALDREVDSDEDRLWALWARAFVLNALKRPDGRDQALDALRQVSARQEKPEAAEDETTASAPPLIRFPDGLSISLPAAEKILTAPVTAPSAKPALPESRGPLKGIEMAWAFESDSGTVIRELIPLADGALLALDDQGTVYRIDGATGKLIWSERYAIGTQPPVSQSGSGAGGSMTVSNAYFRVQQTGLNITVQQLVAPYNVIQLGPGAGKGRTDKVADAMLAQAMASDGAGRFFLATVDEVRCYDAAAGNLLWQAPLEGKLEEDPLAALSRQGQSEEETAAPEVSLHVEGERLLAFVPGGDVAACFDLRSGKLLWRETVGSLEPDADAVAMAADAPLFGLNTGASVHGERMLVYGKEAAILDTANGQTLWRFDGESSRRFPLNLSVELPHEEKPGVSSSDLFKTSAILATGIESRDYHLESDTEEVQRFLQYPGALVAPAAQWSLQRTQGGRHASMGVIAGDRLLLMGKEDLRTLNLDLPLSSLRIPAQATYLGQVGTHLWFLEPRRLLGVDPSGGDSPLTVSLDALCGDEGQARALVAGSRLYALGDQGLRIINGHNGQPILQSRWPDKMVSYTEKRPVSAYAPEPGAYVWQGIVKRPAGRPAWCQPVRDCVGNGFLYVFTGDGSFAALREPVAKPEKKAPQEPAPVPASPRPDPNAAPATAPPTAPTAN